MAGTDLIRQRLYELSVDDESMFQLIRKQAWERVLRRLKSREPISETQLFRLFSEINKLQFSMESKVHEHKDEKEVEIMSLIRNDGIPIEHRRQLLHELEERNVDVTQYRKVLEQGDDDGR